MQKMCVVFESTLGHQTPDLMVTGLSSQKWTCQASDLFWEELLSVTENREWMKLENLSISLGAHSLAGLVETDDIVKNWMFLKDTMTFALGIQTGMPKYQSEYRLCTVFDRNVYYLSSYSLRRLIVVLMILKCDALWTGDPPPPSL